MKALNEMAPHVIHWPTKQDLPSIKEKFKAMAGIDGVIDALDETYMSIKALSKDAETYRNRKQHVIRQYVMFKIHRLFCRLF